MPIIRARNHVEEYQAYAKAGRFEDLSQRRSEMNRRVAAAIVPVLDLTSEDVLADIGCGCGDLLSLADVGTKVGVLPTMEEVVRVKSAKPNLDIRKGLVQAIPLPDGFATKTACNSVLQALDSEDDVRKGIAELVRITAPEGLVYIGEVPDSPVPIKWRHDSVRAWLWSLLRNGGPKHFVAGIKDLLVARFTDELFVIYPSRYLHFSQKTFIGMGHGAGLELTADRTTPHSSDRRDYIFRKPHH